MAQSHNKIMGEDAVHDFQFFSPRINRDFRHTRMHAVCAGRSGRENHTGQSKNNGQFAHYSARSWMLSRVTRRSESAIGLEREPLERYSSKRVGSMRGGK